MRGRAAREPGGLGSRLLIGVSVSRIARRSPILALVALPPNLGEPTLDLHGLRLREALHRTDAFLRREQAQGTVAVRIITGQGGGILKQAIGDLLAQHPSVARVTTALQGDAARVVVLLASTRR